MTKCGFCKTELPTGQAFEVCDRCGVGIWGEKMFLAIKQNMENAKDEGNLYQGFIGEK